MADYTDQLINFRLEVEKELNKFLKTEFLKKYGDKIIDIIYKRTKTGKGVSDSGNKASITKLQALAQSYIERRKKKPGKGEFFSPSRSNLTYSGQLLDAMTFNISNGVISVYIKDSTRSDSDSTNAEVANYVEENGRKFFNLAVEEQKIITTMIEKDVRDIIRRKFGK